MEDLDSLLDQAKSNLNKFADEQDTSKDGLAFPKLTTSLKKTEEPVMPQKSLKSIKALPSKVKAEVKETAGSSWFDLGKPEMTPELKRDLDLLKMRHALDPKRHYKKEEFKSKYFAVGTLQEDPTEYFSARMTRKQRKQTLAEEILATRTDYYKSKYHQIQAAKTSGRKRHYKKVKDMRA